MSSAAMGRRWLLFVVVPTLALQTAEALPAQSRPLAPMATTGLPVTPFMEGWYPNDDGSFTVSFGYYNPNEEQVVRIPVGENNLLEPAQFGGFQPTVFMPGRHRGVFAVTIPSETTELLWTIRNRNGEVHEVPGRATVHSYQLDRNPRPAGSLPPQVAFSENGPWGWDPSGISDDRPRDARVGEPLALTVWTQDPSQRDPEDPRFDAARSLRVIWSVHQAPTAGNVTFTRHELTPVPEPPAEGSAAARRAAPQPGPEEIMLPDGSGPARIYATFSQPGQYILRAQADNWRAPDSSSGDQCCWSNAFVKVNVR